MQLTLNRNDILAAERELCRRSLADFAKRAWHVIEPSAALRWGWALDLVCAHLEAVTRGECKRLLINVPPGMMKSLLTCVIWPAWEWGPCGLPERRFLSAAHKQDLAVRDSTKCRRLIQSEWYQSLWPIVLTSDQNAKTKFENNKTGVREVTAFKTMTGQRADRIVIDDPLAADDANSEAELAAAEITFNETVPTRVNNEDSAIVVIMQRLHERDTSGLILARELGYTHLCLPMRYEPERRCVTPWGEDQRTVEGELLMPERFSETTVTELERSLGGYAAAGQLQQRPTPRGGGIFKDEWWRYWSFPPPAVEFRVVIADTAQKTGQENDPSVLICGGRTKTGQAIVLDLIRGKWEAPDLLTHARAFWRKHQAVTGLGPLRAMHVEDKVSGTGLIQTLRREGLPIIATPRSRDKTTRGYDAAPFVQSNNVLLPAEADWLSDFLKEASAFPNGAHDDQIDTIMDLITLAQSVPSTPMVAISASRNMMGGPRKW